jgi:hypothetical protein
MKSLFHLYQQFLSQDHYRMKCPKLAVMLQGVRETQSKIPPLKNVKHHLRKKSSLPKPYADTIKQTGKTPKKLKDDKLHQKILTTTSKVKGSNKSFLAETPTTILEPEDTNAIKTNNNRQEIALQK